MGPTSQDPIFLTAELERQYREPQRFMLLTECLNGDHPNYLTVAPCGFLHFEIPQGNTSWQASGAGDSICPSMVSLRLGRPASLPPVDLTALPVALSEDIDRTSAS